VECTVSFSELEKSSVAHLAWTERSGVKAERRGKEEALNLKHEIRKEETEPRMDAKEREWDEYEESER
jgi:hypothetical protein